MDMFIISTQAVNGLSVLASALPRDRSLTPTCEALALQRVEMHFYTQMLN